ncbi:MAG: ROK family protein, partial [Thermoanaerobacterium sp.]|nr:ROK family protein [Thermoanaerobacterium sp.]
KKKQLLTEAKYGREAIINNVYILIDELWDLKVSGIGIGSAGRINTDTGIIDYATDNLPGWTGFDVKGAIEKKYGLPVFVDNDVNTAAIGEAWIGAGRGYKNLFMMALGTGVGGAIILNNELIRGSHWSAGEIGHSILYPGGKQCNCGQKGCLEQYISGSAIYKRYNKICGYNKVKNAMEVFDLYLKNDSISKIVIDEFVNLLSLSIISLKNIIDPDLFIIGGGLIGAKDIWWSKLIKSLDKYKNIDVKYAELGNDATMIGAAKLILDRLNK